MKNATLILVVANTLSSRAGGKPAEQNTAFSWLSTTNVTPTVSR